MDAVWIVGAGIIQVPFIEEAKKLGLAVVVTDGQENAPGMAMADYHSVLSTYDIEGHRSLARRMPRHYLGYRFRGVATAGADVACTVAAVAEELGLPGISVPVAGVMQNKARVRATLDAAWLQQYQPWWSGSCYTRHSRDIGTASMVAGGFPLVVKPVSQRASRGVTLVNTLEELHRATDKALQYDDAYLVEQRLFGTEHSAEMLFDGKHVVFFNIVDRIFRYDSGLPVEVGHINPTDLPNDQCNAIFDMMVKAAAALGITWGPFKCDVIVTHDGPKILECAARLSGGFDSTGTSLLTGRYQTRQLLQLACGMPVEAGKSVFDHDVYAAAPTIWAPKRGIATHLPAYEGAGAKVIWNVKLGAAVQQPTHLAERCGFVLTTGRTHQEAWDHGLAVAQLMQKTMGIEEF